MEDKERNWLQKRVGYFTSSSLHNLMSASGKFIEGNITYLLEIERQRVLNEPAPSISSAAMTHGLENERYAYEWVKENMFPEAIYAQDLDEIPFKTTNYGLGASYDVWVGWDLHIDIKCPFSQKELSFYFSPSIPYEVKKERAFEQHCYQMAGQLLCDSNLGSIAILKYDAQVDSNEFDLRSPLDPSRGIYFEFDRYTDFDLDKYEKRIRFANEYLESGKNILEINNEWYEKKEKTD